MNELDQEFYAHRHQQQELTLCKSGALNDKDHCVAMVDGKATRIKVEREEK